MWSAHWGLGAGADIFPMRAHGRATAHDYCDDAVGLLYAQRLITARLRAVRRRPNAHATERLASGDCA